MIVRALRALGLGVATVAIAALLSSFVLMLIVAPPDWPAGPARGDSISLEVFLAGTFVSAPFIALGLVLVGVPADFVLRIAECRNPLAYAACGMIGGLGLIAIVTWDEQYVPGFFSLSGMGYGLVTSLVFWAVFRRWRAAAFAAEPGS